MNHLKESTRTFLTPTNKKNNPKMGQTGQSIKTAQSWKSRSIFCLVLELQSDLIGFLKKSKKK